MPNVHAFEGERERERERNMILLVGQNLKMQKFFTFKYSLSKGNLLSATSLTALRRTYTLSARKLIEVTQ